MHLQTSLTPDTLTMSDEYKRQSIIFFVVIALLIGIVSLLPSTMRDQAVELQCKLRLKRMGDAVNYWIYENNFKGFPQIKNPKPQQAWVPNRHNSAGNILRQYLGGDIPRKRHDNESQSSYHQRLRKQELSVCPRSGYEYWYDSISLSQSDVRKISEAPEHHSQQLRYFSCQHHQDGSAPHQLDESTGVYAAYGIIVHRVISKNDLDQLQQQLNIIEQDNAQKPASEWSHDLLFLRKRVAAYAASLAEHPEGFPAITLDTDIRFIPEP